MATLLEERNFEFQEKSSHGFKTSPVVADRDWVPYVNNGGSALAVAGDSYVVIAADTRLSVGYSIHTRNFSKITKLTCKCLIATSGMQADMLVLHKILKTRIAFYEHAHRREPTTEAVAQMLSTVLYQRRFFPLYTFNIIAGLDSNGKGSCYQYDAIGSFDLQQCVTTGTGGALMMSILDNRIGMKNQSITGTELDKTSVIMVVDDAIRAATERDIFTGDRLEIVVLDETGIWSAN